MIKHTKHSVYGFLLSIFASILLTSFLIQSTANAYDGGKKDYTTLNKKVSVDDGVSTDEISSVNGKVDVGDNVTADEVSSVNGKLDIGRGLTANSVSSVNGKIEIGRNATIDRDVEAVNGKIEVGPSSKVGGSVTTVNGAIELVEVEVGSNIETVNGSIYLTDGTIVEGDVIMGGRNSRNNNNWRNKPPKLVVDIASNIKGNIIIYREIDFKFADETLMEKVIDRSDDY